MTGYIQPEDYLTAFRKCGTPEQFAEGLQYVQQWKGRMEEYHQRLNVLEGDVKGLGARMTSMENGFAVMRTSLEGKLDTITTSVAAIQTEQTKEAGRRLGMEEAAKAVASQQSERATWVRFIIGLVWGVALAVVVYAATAFVRNNSHPPVSATNVEINE